MLSRLLETIADMDNPEGIPLCVVVIENGPVAPARDVVASFRNRLDIRYFREKRTGLVHARNAAIERSLETGAEWIGFLDDDERVSPVWLRAMCEAMERFPAARAFAGPVRLHNPAGATRWFPPPKKFNIRTGQPLWDITTGNLLLKRELLDRDGLGMRFDMAYNLSGGEDTDLALRLRRAGVKILWVQDARCDEDILPKNAGFRAKTALSIHYMHNFGRVNIRLYGAVSGRLLNAFLVVKWTFHAIAYLLAGGISGIFSRQKGQALIARGIQRACMGIGHFRSLYRGLDSHYVTVDGH